MNWLPWGSITILLCDRCHYYRGYALPTSLILHLSPCSAPVPCIVPLTHSRATDHDIEPHSLNSTAVLDMRIWSRSSIRVHHEVPNHFMYILRHISVMTCYSTLIIKEKHKVRTFPSIFVNLCQYVIFILTRTDSVKWLWPIVRWVHGSQHRRRDWYSDLWLAQCGDVLDFP